MVEKRILSEPIHCEWPEPSAPPTPAADARSRVHRHRGDYSWEGIERHPYKGSSEEWAAAHRMVLIGRAAEPVSFHLRYFEVEPGGFTSLEKHHHAHVVIVARGRGTVVAGDECWDVGFLDVVYIAPLTPHQFLNAGEEPFGFFCIVDAVRDRPQPLTEPERERVMRIPAVAAVMRALSQRGSRART